MQLCSRHGNPVGHCVDCRLESHIGSVGLSAMAERFAAAKKSHDGKNENAKAELIARVKQVRQDLAKVDLDVWPDSELFWLAKAAGLVLDTSGPYPAVPAEPVDPPTDPGGYAGPTSASHHEAPAPPDLAAIFASRAKGEQHDEGWSPTPPDVPVSHRAPGAPAPRLAPGAEENIRKYGQVPALTPEQFQQAMVYFSESRGTVGDAVVAIRRVRNGDGQEGA